MLDAINNVIMVVIAGVLVAHQCLLIKGCLLFKRREVISKSAVLSTASCVLQSVFASGSIVRQLCWTIALNFLDLRAVAIS